MGDKEEAENDRRKLMNKIFCSALTAVVAGAMLTGCAMPWEKGADDDVAPGGYSYTADSNSEQKQAYRWLIEPTINADNIISFDGRDRKSTRLNSSHSRKSRMPSSA